MISALICFGVHCAIAHCVPPVVCHGTKALHAKYDMENCSLKLLRLTLLKKGRIGVEKQPSGINIEWNGKASLSLHCRHCYTALRRTLAARGGIVHGGNGAP